MILQSALELITTQYIYGVCIGCQLQAAPPDLRSSIVQLHHIYIYIIILFSLQQKPTQKKSGAHSIPRIFWSAPAIRPPRFRGALIGWYLFRNMFGARILAWLLLYAQFARPNKNIHFIYGIASCMWLFFFVRGCMFGAFAPLHGLSVIIRTPVPEPMTTSEL